MNPAVMNIPIQVEWQPGEMKRNVLPPWVIIRLKADGEEIRTIVLTEKDEWKYTFMGMAGQWNGRDIHYSLTVDPVENYLWEIRGAKLIGWPLNEVNDPVKKNRANEEGKTLPLGELMNDALMEKWARENCRTFSSGGECFD